MSEGTPFPQSSQLPLKPSPLKDSYSLRSACHTLQWAGRLRTCKEEGPAITCSFPRVVRQGGQWESLSDPEEKAQSLEGQLSSEGVTLLGVGWGCRKLLDPLSSLSDGDATWHQWKALRLMEKRGNPTAFPPASVLLGGLMGLECH